ncbi:hypothetical protein ABZP36_023457 [Zizania latifolia]
MDRQLWLPRRRRPEPAAIDITWVSCKGVKSSLPFHTPCLYASIYVQRAAAAASHGGGGARPHRVKTATDRTGGGNPEWDVPLRLYLPVEASSPPSGERESSAAGDNYKEEDHGGFLMRFEVKSEVAVLGNVLSASAAVPVTDLVADGTWHRVKYQLAGPDGRQPNGVISFSYAFHVDRSANSDVDEDRSCCSSSDGESITPPHSVAARSIALPPPPPPPPAQSSGPTMYPVIDWPLTEQVPLLLHPPLTAGTAAITSPTCYPPPPPPTPPVEPIAVYPPAPAPATSACGMYPTVREPAGGGMYPTVDLDPVSCYMPAAPIYGGGCGYAAPPEWDGRRLHS